MENNNELHKDTETTDKDQQTANTTKRGKKKVKVINVPQKRKKKKPLQTPSNIIRLCLVWSFVLCLLLLTYPFLNAQLYINDELEVSPNPSSAGFKLATQEEVNDVTTKLKSALDNLVEAPKEEESSNEASDKNSVDETSGYESQTSQTSKNEEQKASVREMNTAHYEWQYSIAKDIDIKSTMSLLDEAMNIDRSKYTKESADELNTAVLNTQRTLCASVVISQSALQMMIGGSVNEAFGDDNAVGDSIFRGLLAFALAIIPIVCFLTASFDKRRHIKHVVIMLGAILALADIFFTIYPYIGIGATLSIVMYIIICALNIASIYAKQQEDYIVKHPEMEAEFTQKHPQLIKALLNEKALGHIQINQDTKIEEYKSAKNAKKHYNKKKKKKSK